jgi:hypothetical protein
MHLVAGKYATGRLDRESVLVVRQGGWSRRWVWPHLEAHRDNALVHRLAPRLVEHLRMLTIEIDELAAEITERVTIVAPSLLAISAAAR